MKSLFQVMIVSLCLLMAVAFAHARGGRGAGGGSGPNYVDQNGDGVCDNFRAGKRFKNRRSLKGARGESGPVTESSATRTVGPNYVDEDGDGVCDNRGKRTSTN